MKACTSKLSQRADEITESYLNGNISWTRNELKKRNGKTILELVAANLACNVNMAEAGRFRSLMAGR